MAERREPAPFVAPDLPTPGRLRLSPWWLVFSVALLAIPSAELLRRGPRGLPVLAQLPDFTLTDQAGAPFGRQELLGKVWIADFVFTSCPDVCPLLTQKMRSLQDRLTTAEQARIGLLSISVDPERDTPRRLQSYAERFGADGRLWRFLTGPAATVERTVVEGFKIGVEKVPVPSGLSEGEVHEAAFDILHGEKFVLVDEQGRVRAYHDVRVQGGLEALLAEARALAAGGR
jgi:protein SCO1